MNLWSQSFRCWILPPNGRGVLSTRHRFRLNWRRGLFVYLSTRTMLCLILLMVPAQRVWRRYKMGARTSATILCLSTVKRPSGVFKSRSRRVNPRREHDFSDVVASEHLVLVGTFGAF